MSGKVDDIDVAELIGPVSPGDDPELRAIAVMTLTGSASIDGRSQKLGNSTDQALFTGLRQWSDVVLVGAGTVRAENYFGVRTSPELAETRMEQGQDPVPPIAVLSRNLTLDPDSQFFTDIAVPPLVLVPQASLDDPGLSERRGRVLDAGGELVSTGAGAPADIVEALHERGLKRISLEGGPDVFTAFFDAELVDVLHLTLDPVVNAPVEKPLLESAPGDAPFSRRLSLDYFAATADGSLFLRYRRR